MNRQITVKTLAAALLMAGLGMGWLGHSSKAVEQPTYTVNQAITVQEKGKPARKCTIVAATSQPDGSTTYTLKAADTGELITIHDKPTSKGTGKEPTKPEMVKATAPAPKIVKAPAPVAKVEAKPVAAVKAPAPAMTVEMPKPAPVKAPEKVPEAAWAQAPKFADPIPLAKDRSSDPLLQVPGEPRRDNKPEPIIANVNEAGKSKPVVVKSDARESRSFFGWFSSSKSAPAAIASPADKTVPAPTVSSAITAKPVIVETGIPVATGYAANKPGLASVTSYGSGPAVRAGVGRDNNPGLATVGEPMKAMPVPAPIPMTQPPVTLPSTMMPSVYPGTPVSQAPAALPRDVQLQKTLKEALQPSEREIAAMQLCDTSNARSPAVKTALMTAAKEDPAATVRAACLRCLTRVAPGESSLIPVLETAKADPDPRVRNEANELLLQIRK